MSRRPVDVVSLRRVRWTARAPRIAAAGTCAVLSLLGLRSLLTPEPTRVPQPAPPRPVTSAAAFAEGFARAYFTYDRDAPDRRDRALAAYMPASQITADELPRRDERVVWSAVAATEPSGGRRLIVTVAVETTSAIRYLAVTVDRDGRGRLFIPSPPALVGPLPVAMEAAPPVEEEVDDAALRAVAARVVKNFLARERDDLVADLDPRAVVSLPHETMRLASVDGLTWTSGRKVAVAVTASTADGLRLSLRYELGAVRRGGRWLVRTVHVNPAAREAAQ